MTKSELIETVQNFCNRYQDIKYKEERLFNDLQKEGQKHSDIEGKWCSWETNFKLIKENDIKTYIELKERKIKIDKEKELLNEFTSKLCSIGFWGKEIN